MKYAVLVLTCMATLAGPAAFADSNAQSELSERRAQAVNDALASAGSSQTVNGSGTQSDREQNRRVEIALNSRQVRALVSK